MVGIKRPARETEPPRAKKLKVQNAVKSLPTGAGNLPSKNVFAQRTESENTSENDSDKSDLSMGEEDEDVKEISGPASLDKTSKRTQGDAGGGKAIVNGTCPFARWPHSYSRPR
jgi:hypothetical protein